MNTRIQAVLGRCIATAAALLAVAGSLTAATLATAQPSAVQSAPAHTPGVTAVASIGVTVSDLDRSVAFYTDVLGFRQERTWESSGLPLERLTGVFGARTLTARLRLGDEAIELTQYLAPEGRPIPPDSRSNDRWFQHIAIVVSDIDQAYARLRAGKVRHASSGPQTLPAWNTSAAGISAFYFKDPDGHVLEIIHFPAGKGDPRWQSPHGGLFLGIDHTAIVVSDTEKSLAFYRDVLGMRIAGSSENYGTEQEHLNNVFGARLRITALRSPQGPGIELLEYLAPSDGRGYPDDAGANDGIHWHTTVVTTDAPALCERLREARVAWVSPGLVADLEEANGLSSGAEVKDPDGHVVRVAQRFESMSADEPAAHAGGGR